MPFLAGDNRYGTHGPTMLRHLGPETDLIPGESAAFAALWAGSGPTGKVLIPLPTWYALMLRVKKFHFSGTVTASWNGSGAPPTFPPVSGGPVSIADEFDIVHHYTGHLQHGDIFTGESPDGFPEAISKDERDILGPNVNWEGDDNPETLPEDLPHGLRQQRGLQNKGIFGQGGQSLPGPSIFGSYSYWSINLGATPPIGGGDYYDNNGVYYGGIVVQFGCGIPSLLNGFQADGVSSDGTPSNGSITVKIHGYPDFAIPLVKSGFIIRRPFTVLGVVTTSFTANGILEAKEFWEYRNSAGAPVYDRLTGIQLVDPLS